MRKIRESLAMVVRTTGFGLRFGPRGSRPRRVALIILMLVACLALVVPVLAQVSANYDLSWHVIAGGGGRMAGTQHTLQGTTGQSVVGSAVSSGYTLCSGFWCGVAETGYWVYLPLVVRNTY